MATPLEAYCLGCHRRVVVDRRFNAMICNNCEKCLTHNIDLVGQYTYCPEPILVDISCPVCLTKGKSNGISI